MTIEKEIISLTGFDKSLDSLVFFRAANSNGMHNIYFFKSEYEYLSSHASPLQVSSAEYMHLLYVLALNLYLLERKNYMFVYIFSFL